MTIGSVLGGLEGLRFASTAISLHPRKLVIKVWWNMTGVIHYSFFRTGMTITTKKYCQCIEENQLSFNQLNS